MPAQGGVAFAVQVRAAIQHLANHGRWEGRWRERDFMAINLIDVTLLHSINQEIWNYIYWVLLRHLS